MPTSGKARRWVYRCVLATEFAVIVLLILGGCYSKQDYQALSPQAGDEVLNKRNVVVEGRIVYVREDKLRSWWQQIFCYPLTSEEPSGPDRYDVSIDIDTVIKGDSAMPRRLQINKCLPVTNEEALLFSRFSNSDTFPNNVRVKVGFNSQHGNSFRNLILVPLGSASTSKPSTIIPSEPGAR